MRLIKILRAKKIKDKLQLFIFPDINNGNFNEYEWMEFIKLRRSYIITAVIWVGLFVIIGLAIVVTSKYYGH